MRPGARLTQRYRAHREKPARADTERESPPRRGGDERGEGDGEERGAGDVGEKGRRAGARARDAEVSRGTTGGGGGRGGRGAGETRR